MARSISTRDRVVRFATEYEDQTPDEDTLVIPSAEELEALSAEDLTALSEKATEAFEAIYGDGTDLSDDDLEALRGLTEGIETISAEEATRHAAAEARAAEAAELAAKVRPVTDETDAEGGDGDDDAEDGDDAEGEGEGEDSEGEAAPVADGDEADAEVVEVTAEDAEPQPEAIAASARKEVRVNLGNVRSRQSTTSRPVAPAKLSSIRDVVHAASDAGKGFTNGMDLLDMGKVVDRHLTKFNAQAYASAARRGDHMREQFGVAVIDKPFDPKLIVKDEGIAGTNKVLDYAVDESRLPGGSLLESRSLTASGGWCAPSETLYDLFDDGASRDGLFSLPEIQITRGGINFTRGPDFASLYANTGFNYTEQEDIDGDYDGEGGGSKPCFKVECPDFDEERMQLDGLCITAGLLQTRGYPEMIAATVRKALIAHDHRLSSRIIAAVVAGSTPATMPTPQVGALAPILTSIELQVEHYKEVHRLRRATTLEAVFPFWVRGAIRADLSRRLGIDLIDVPDSRIDAWFRSRGVSPQYVYNWQGLASDTVTGAESLDQFPETVDFLLYSAGTWVKGGSDVITLDTIYDSVQLGTNDYTALFTEEGWLVAKRGFDSRVITVPICADGATAAGVAIECDGTAGA